MRGKAFHNKIADETEKILIQYGWKTNMEHCIKADNITTYFDVYAVKGNRVLACEIETTPRHAIDNVAKALITKVPLWIIVPTRAVRRQIEQKLKAVNIASNNQNLKVLLLNQIEGELL